MLDWADFARLGTVAAVVWSGSWFIYRQIDNFKTIMLDKLEYHERHDDVRFDNVRKDMYQLGIRVAANSGRINGKE